MLSIHLASGKSEAKAEIWEPFFVLISKSFAADDDEFMSSKSTLSADSAISRLKIHPKSNLLKLLAAKQPIIDHSITKALHATLVE